MTPEEILELLPQREPFRFVDEILELDDDHVLAAHTWRPEADFYRGHFPGNPVTPGVLLVESMAQGGVVVLALHLMAKDDASELEKLAFYFTEANVEWSGVVRPGERILIRSRKVFFRRRKLRCEVEATREDGEVVCSGTLAGMGVPK